MPVQANFKMNLSDHTSRPEHTQVILGWGWHQQPFLFLHPKPH